MSNDIEEIRRAFAPGRGERAAGNVVLDLCDEVEALRATNRELAGEVVRLREQAETPEGNPS